MRYCGRNNAAISLYFKVVFTFYLLPTPPYRSTQRCIVEQQMSDIDIRRQIWHLAAPIDWDGLLGESGGGGEVGAGQILKWEKSLHLSTITSMQMSLLYNSVGQGNSLVAL